MLLCDVQLINL